MTTLNNPVARIIPAARRALVVRLVPPSMIEFREKGTRRRYTLGLQVLFYQAVQAAVEADRRARRKRRKS